MKRLKYQYLAVVIHKWNFRFQWGFDSIVGDLPSQVEFDGTDLWVANFTSATVMRIRPSDGKLLDTWTEAIGANSILCAMGKVFITGNAGRLYMIDPTQPAGTVTTVTTFVGSGPRGITFDGSRIWTANTDGSSISIISLNPTSVTTVSIGFNNPIDILYDFFIVFLLYFLTLKSGIDL
jgi:DNA-binding beta-propeller fold protein YncE